MSLVKLGVRIVERSFISLAGAFAILNNNDDSAAGSA